MFVYSVKASKKSVAIIVASVIALIALSVFILGKSKTPATTNGDIVFRAENAQERVAFLSQFGWKVASDPAEVSEVIIPSEFDIAFTEYNEINKSQGLDLEPYKGMRAKRWTYDILNYPGYEGQKGVVQANILIYDGRIIGGDVCSLELGGFMHGFESAEDMREETSHVENDTAPAKG